MHPRVASTYCVEIGCVDVVVGTGPRTGLVGVVIFDVIAVSVVVVGVFKAAVRCWDGLLANDVVIVVVECGRVVVCLGVVWCVLC